jgi:hypothetical protein
VGYGKETPGHGDRRQRNSKRVLVICQLDRYANGLKPVAIEQFLRRRGHDVRLVDTYYLSRATSSRGSFASKLPSPRPRKAVLYATEAASLLLTRRWKFGRRLLSYHLLVADHQLRGAILASSLPLDAFDLVICETPYDAGVLTHPTSAITLYDCPAPWADEVHYDGRLSSGQHEKLRRLERQLFESVDHLAFHWESYTRYALERYGISGRNLLTLNFGCTPSARRARFADPPRVVYLGNLSASFNDTPLLARLAALYPHIDVYGGPPPDPGLGLNYLGYAPSVDILRQYQLGLVTCSKDALRREGFSSKHLQYLTYGLPVLVPAWRRHLDLLRGSVPYTEQTFRSVIDEMSNQERWQAASDEAYGQALRLDWEETLRPLEDLLAGHGEAAETPQRT